MADEKKSVAVDYKAVSLAALQSVQVANDKALASLPDEGGKEPDVVKGARGMLLGVKDNIAASIAAVEG